MCDSLSCRAISPSAHVALLHTGVRSGWRLPASTRRNCAGRQRGRGRASPMYCRTCTKHDRERSPSSANALWRTSVLLSWTQHVHDNGCRGQEREEGEGRRDEDGGKRIGKVHPCTGRVVTRCPSTTQSSQWPLRGRRRHLSVTTWKAEGSGVQQSRGAAGTAGTAGTAGVHTAGARAHTGKKVKRDNDEVFVGVLDVLA
jgi:hypothetical protein